MKKSTYNVLMLILNILSLILLTIICVHLNIIKVEGLVDWLTPAKDAILKFLRNDYVVNILCTILTAVILYILQIKYSKHKLKRDIRCNEIIHDLYTGIEETQTILNDVQKFNTELEPLKKLSYLERQKPVAQKYVEFYSNHECNFHLSNVSFTYHNNDILIDSINTVFFINLNFKLLNIINNIKNRKPNLVEKYPSIESLYEQYKKEKSDDVLIQLGNEIEHYLTDLKFMAQYWLALLNYLGHDPIPTKLYIEFFNELYPTTEDAIKFYNLPTPQQHKISKKIIRKAAWVYFKYKVKNFFK